MLACKVLDVPRLGPHGIDSVYPADLCCEWFRFWGQAHPLPVALAHDGTLQCEAPTLRKCRGSVVGEKASATQHRMATNGNKPPESFSPGLYAMAFKTSPPVASSRSQSCESQPALQTARPLTRGPSPPARCWSPNAWAGLVLARLQA